ncbi:hypothetical protein FE840_001435 [Peteryoungia desertarenae]|uniref:Uncharacterized protein n=1 Tax=Peteryoungia desertarenae TaxID=1813451 RepID=A0ABX6QIP9_9HYPH|nr:hypothetical protein [Peteryoungia desertarenae]QLF68322.1 hypothetical protein FE840_001435 [Peteryoungia desertarenae]
MNNNLYPSESVTIRVGAVRQTAIKLDLNGVQFEYPHKPLEVWAVTITSGTAQVIIESVHANEEDAVDHAKRLEAKVDRLGRLQ